MLNNCAIFDMQYHLVNATYLATWNGCQILGIAGNFYVPHNLAFINLDDLEVELIIPETVRVHCGLQFHIHYFILISTARYIIFFHTHAFQQQSGGIYEQLRPRHRPVSHGGLLEQPGIPGFLDDRPTFCRIQWKLTTSCASCLCPLGDWARSKLCRKLCSHQDTLDR